MSKEVIIPPVPMFKKNILPPLLVLLSFLIVGLYLFNPAVEKIMNKMLSSNLNSFTNIGQVDVSFSSFQASIKDIHLVENRSKKTTLDIDKITLKVDAIGEKIILETLDLDTLNLALSQEDNQLKPRNWFTSPGQEILAIQANINASSQTQVVVKNLLIRNISAYVSAQYFRQVIDLPDIRVSNFGQGDPGILLSDLPSEVINLVLEQIKTIIDKKIKHKLEQESAKVIKERQEAALLLEQRKKARLLRQKQKKQASEKYQKAKKERIEKLKQDAQKRKEQRLEEYKQQIIEQLKKTLK